MVKRFVILCALSMCIVLGSYAQNVTIQGRLISGKDIVDFANVILRDSNSNYVSGVMSDKKGNFFFVNVKPSDYTLTASSVGYDDKSIKVSARQDVYLGDIKIDSTVNQLGEVVVKAAKVIRTDEGQVALPTKFQVKASNNGVELLRSMQLSRLNIDPINNKITTSTPGDVQLRINGARADIYQVRALRPEEIQRIEYHDDPGMKYGIGVACVLDYITKRAVRGGQVSADLMGSPFDTFDQGQLQGSLNRGNSQFGTFVWSHYKGLNSWRENSETFNNADGTSFTRVEDGKMGPFKMKYTYANVYYNYKKKDDLYFSIQLNNSYSNTKQNINSSLYSMADKSNAVDMRDDNYNVTERPWLDIYFQRNFDKRHNLMVNVVGTYIRNKVDRNYREVNDADTLTNINSYTRGNKYSVIAQAIYSAGLTKNGTLSFGFTGSQAYTSNAYTGNVIANTNMHDGYGIVFAEWKQKIGKKLHYSIGSYLSYVWVLQGNKSIYKTIPYPKASVSYTINDKSSVRLSMERSYTVPGLGDLSDVDQIIDSVQIRRGNPDLKVSYTWQGNLNYEYHSKMFNINASLFYMNQHNPVMEDKYIENGIFVNTIFNQKSWQKLNPELQLQIGPIFDILSFNVTGGMSYFDSYGVDYRHYYTNWYFNGTMILQYKRLTLSAQIQNHRNDLYGETCSYGESLTVIDGKYRLNDRLNVGFTLLNPFQSRSSYNLPVKNYNKYAPSSQSTHIKESAKLFLLTVNWNFSFGRKYEGIQKQLNNGDSNAGTMKSGK